MDIDWFTFVAQIINFLILVGLLRWLLYGPITKAMSQREQRIADRLDEADRQRRQAEQEKQTYQQKSSDLDSRREELLGKAKQDADDQRKQLIQNARREVDRRRDQWTEAFQRDQQQQRHETQRETAKLATAIARQTLALLADTPLQAGMVSQFIRRLSDIDSKQRDQILQNLKDSQDTIVIRSGCELGEEEQLRLRDAVHDSLGPGIAFHFEIDEELICGIELVAGGYSLTWNAGEFINEIDQQFSKALKMG
ncbi:F0F1 ATP synthase subunit B family protein [Novipirellula artificiosorum]|uniref:ATP synthase subunit b n=1 Tax=Novipirellula artificiosorum TaxID=2528016 RepID=A0A5C6DUA0_9BACT|nr:F0F1 ATP synthase subunit B [Novipirellula artificiosorum]TWU38349.1 ATP synthase subunit b, sodium ion specific [Novipirellula artificiosorum]